MTGKKHTSSTHRKSLSFPQLFPWTLKIFYQDLPQLKSVDFLLINETNFESMNLHARVYTKNYVNEFHTRKALSVHILYENTNASAWPQINMQVVLYTLRAPVEFNCTGCSSRAVALCLILLFCAVKGSKTASTSPGERNNYGRMSSALAGYIQMHLGAWIQNKWTKTAELNLQVLQQRLDLHHQTFTSIFLRSHIMQLLYFIAHETIRD